MAKKPHTLATLFGLGKGLGLTPDEAKEMAYSLIGKDSLRQFTQAEIDEVCREMVSRLALEEKHQYSDNRASDSQLYRIGEYERLLGWADEPERLTSFIKNRFGVLHVRWLTPVQASKVIEGLKKMHRRKEAATG